MAIDRRKFLQVIGATSLAAVATNGRAVFARQLHHSALPNSAGNPLRIPSTFSGGTITATTATREVWPGFPTELMTFNGEYPAPTIRLRRGDVFSVKFRNQLGEPSSIHWHGLIVPPEMDGHPMDVVAPGGEYQYTYQVNQRAGTYWYHPHPHMTTGKQVYKGMAGLLVVTDDEEQALDLPRGEFDVPLVIQDRKLLADRSFTYNLLPGTPEHQYGYLGDAVLVNGTPDAYLEVAAGLYRFRILNGSNARIYDLAFSDGLTFNIVANDGGLLEKPYPVTSVYNAPAERLEILVDFSGYTVGQSVTLKGLAWSGSTNPLEQGCEQTIMRFDIVRTGTPASTPSILAPYEILNPLQSKRVRTFDLEYIHDVQENEHRINNKFFEMTRIDEEVPVGDLETWVITNTTFLSHPIHLHGAQFQILERQGPLLPSDLGWKDTVRIRSFEDVRLLVRFSNSIGVYLAHCHTLEHEDMGMMFNYKITGSVGVHDVGTDVHRHLDLQ